MSHLQEMEQVSRQNIKVELGLLFDKIKQVIKHQQEPLLELNEQAKGDTIRKITKGIYDKIMGREKLQPKLFVGLFSLWSYIKIMVKDEPVAAKLSQKFFQNVTAHIGQIVKIWISEDDRVDKKAVKVYLGSIMCSLTSLIKQSSQGELDFNIKLLINPTLVKYLMAVRFPNQQKFMKQYKVLMLSFVKMSLSRIDRRVINSLYYHLVNCDCNYTARIAIVYLLSQASNEGLQLEAHSVWGREEKSAVATTLLMMLNNVENSSQFKLITGFCARLTRQDSDVQIRLDSQQCLDVVHRSYPQASTDIKLHPCFRNVLRKMSRPHQDQIYTRLSVIEKPSSMEIEILEAVTEAMSEQQVFQVLENGCWARLLENMFEGDYSGSTKQIMRKIVENILKNSRFNSLLHVHLQGILQSFETTQQASSMLD